MYLVLTINFMIVLTRISEDYAICTSSFTLTKKVHDILKAGSVFAYINLKIKQKHHVYFQAQTE